MLRTVYQLVAAHAIWVDEHGRIEEDIEFPWHEAIPV
jgi:hypothetical protein